MKVADWIDWDLDPGVLREPNSGTDGNRIVLWLPGPSEGTFQHWERISSVARAEVSVEDGLCATAATSIPTRHRVQGILGKLVGRLRGAQGRRAFVLPG